MAVENENEMPEMNNKEVIEETEDETSEVFGDDDDTIEETEGAFNSDEDAADDAADEDAEEDGISEEEMDQIADTAIAFISDVLKYMNVGEVEINEYEGDDRELILDLTGDNLSILIGRHGKNLDALQFLVSTVTARTMGFRYPIVVDVEGYKARQREKLENIAYNAAERAVSQHRNVRLHPMTPYERRIIHITLADDPRVKTASEGEGAARRVVVLPM